MAAPAIGQDHPGAEPRSQTRTSNSEASEIVVTAAGFEQHILRAPASISVVPREELEIAPFRDLTDALRNIEGVSVTGTANEQDIFIRGLPGAYTLILVDGRRQSSRDSRTNGNSGFEQSFMPPVEAIERIEVVRGPMSSLYGSDAMGGVINIITRKIPDRWGGSLGFDYTLQEHGRYGDNYQGQFYLAGPVASDTLGVQMWGRRYNREETSILNGLNGAKDYDLTGRVAVRLAPGHEMVLEAGTQRVRRENSGGKTLAATAADTYNTNDRDHYAAWYDGSFGDKKLWLSIQQEETQRYIYSRNAASGAFVAGTRAPNVRNRVADLRFSMPLFTGNTLVVGGQWNNTRLIDQNPGARTGLDERFSITQKAVFVEDEFYVTDRLSLTGGVRLDDHDIYGSHWTPRAYVVWEAIDGLVLKGGVTTGFRAPEIRQIAPGYAYTTGGAGCSYGVNGTCGVIVGDPNLKPEKSTSYEINAHYDNKRGLSGGVTLFHTDFRDKVVDVQQIDANGNFIRWSEDPGYRLWSWVNVDKARVRGVEANFRWKPWDQLSLRGGYTFTDSKQRSGNYVGYPLARTPKHMANGRLEWTPTEAITAYAVGWYHGSEINAALRLGSAGTPITTPDGRIVRRYGDYFTADIGASYRMPNGVLINAAIQNVTDKKLDEATYNTVNEGRRLWVGATFRF
ncbi:TonB-dependent receptor [Sphingomonas sp. 3P27F8]|nr:TonB-dependent receptor [Sphingomonas sp. 3P27F8]